MSTRAIVGSIQHAEVQERLSAIFEAEIEQRREEYKARYLVVFAFKREHGRNADPDDLDRLLGPAAKPGRPKNFQRKTTT